MDSDHLGQPLTQGRTVRGSLLADGFDGSAIRHGPNHSTIEFFYDSESQADAAYRAILYAIEDASCLRAEGLGQYTLKRLAETRLHLGLGHEGDEWTAANIDLVLLELFRAVDSLRVAAMSAAQAAARLAVGASDERR
jgi:hypothetical protein